MLSKEEWQKEIAREMFAKDLAAGCPNARYACGMMNRAERRDYEKGKPRPNRFPAPQRQLQRMRGK